jgi:hypothetical protein
MVLTLDFDIRSFFVSETLDSFTEVFGNFFMSHNGRPSLISSNVFQKVHYSKNLADRSAEISFLLVTKKITPM